jgi:hypothetical protein
VLFKLLKTLGQAWWRMPKVPGTPQVEIRRIMVGGQPLQKVSEIPILTKRPGRVVCSCNHNYVRVIGRKTAVWGQPQADTENPVWKITWRHGSNGRASAIHEALSLNSSTAKQSLRKTGHRDPPVTLRSTEHPLASLLFGPTSWISKVYWAADIICRKKKKKKQE